MFLGFTHICATNRRGRFWVRRITDTKRLTAKLKQAQSELAAPPPRPRARQGLWLASVINGHMNYYAVPGNGKAVRTHSGTRHQALARRRWAPSQKTRLTWVRMNRSFPGGYPISSSGVGSRRWGR